MSRSTIAVMAVVGAPLFGCGARHVVQDGVSADNSVIAGTPGMQDNKASVAAPRRRGHKRQLLETYRHLGCFESDAWWDQRMSLALTVIDMTVELCHQKCQVSSAVYFGLQDGQRCWCSSDERFDYDRLGAGTCDRWCGGDGSTMCGGAAAIDVFAVENDQPSPAAREPSLDIVTDPLEELLHLHNSARCAHEARPLEFSEGLGIAAEEQAAVLADDDHCGWDEPSQPIDLGQNVYVCALPSDDPAGDCFSARAAMADFYDGQQGSWDPATFGPRARQVLWKSTTEIGCALEACTRGGLSYSILVCNYWPPSEDGNESVDNAELGARTKSLSTCGYDR